MDVCDDADYAQMLKGYSEQAKAAGVPAITSAGMFHPLLAIVNPEGNRAQSPKAFLEHGCSRLLLPSFSVIDCRKHDT